MVLPAHLIRPIGHYDDLVDGQSCFTLGRRSTGLRCPVATTYLAARESLSDAGCVLEFSTRRFVVTTTYLWLPELSQNEVL